MYIWIRSLKVPILWKADIHILTEMEMCQRWWWSMAISLRCVYIQTEKVSLRLTGVLKRLCVCLLVEGIVSLSQLSHQGAALNGHRIKATSFRNWVNTHQHESGHTTLFSGVKHPSFLWILVLFIFEEDRRGRKHSAHNCQVFRHTPSIKE